MKYLLNRYFARQARDFNLTDEDIWFIFDDILKQRGVSLGHNLYKLRAALKGRGKSAGLRVMFYWKKGHVIILCLLFTKSQQDNMNYSQQKALMLLSEEYTSLNDSELNSMIENNSFEEFNYDQRK